VHEEIHSLNLAQHLTGENKLKVTQKKRKGKNQRHLNRSRGLKSNTRVQLKIQRKGAEGRMVSGKLLCAKTGLKSNLTRTQNSREIRDQSKKIAADKQRMSPYCPGEGVTG